MVRTGSNCVTIPALSQTTVSTRLYRRGSTRSGESYVSAGWQAESHGNGRLGQGVCRLSSRAPA